jgi:hypothetical protein
MSYHTKQLRHMQATVECYDSGDSILTSYSTVVAAIIDGRLYVTPMWDCSVTTLRQVKAYFKDYYGLALPAADLRFKISQGGIHLITKQLLLLRAHYANNMESTNA